MSTVGLNGINAYKLTRGDLLDSPPHIFRDPVYYTDELSDRLRSIRIPTISTISDIRITPVQAGLMDRALLYRLTLLNERYQILGTLFAKVIHKGHKQTNLSPQPLGPVNSMQYQFQQMSAWNDLALPAPRVIDYIQEERPVGNGRPITLHSLLLEDVRSPTHDLDIIAINQVFQLNKRKILNDKFLTEEERAHLEQENITLMQQRKDIFLSALDNINAFAIFGTYGVPNDSIWKPKLPKLHHFQKLVHYMTKALYWRQIKDGNLTIEQYNGFRDSGKLPKNVSREVRAFRKQIGSIRRSLLELMAAAFLDRLVYRQGDEYLHHYAYHEVYGLPLEPNKTSPEVRSVVFDADHATLGILQGAQAKLLVNPIANTSYNEAVELLTEAHERAKATASFAESTAPDRYNNVSSLINEPQYLALKRFDLAAIYELLCCAGRRAMDALTNKRFHDNRVRAGAPYNNAFLKSQVLMPRHLILTRAYDISSSIDRIRELLRERFWRIKGSVNYKLKEEELTAIKGLENLVNTFALV